MGVREHTIPTVETSKYFMHMNDMKTEDAPYKHLNTRLGKVYRSIESIKSFFKCPNPMIKETRTDPNPRMNVNCKTLINGFNSNIALFV